MNLIWGERGFGFVEEDSKELEHSKTHTSFDKNAQPTKTAHSHFAISLLQFLLQSPKLKYILFVSALKKHSLSEFEYETNDSLSGTKDGVWSLNSKRVLSLCKCISVSSFAESG